MYFAGGASALITDGLIAGGQPGRCLAGAPDASPPEEIYGRPRRQAAFDRGFASTSNVEEAKALGLTDVCVHKKRGIEVPDVVRRTWAYRRLRDFRAGIEGVISLLKRVFGLSRCMWRGAASFSAHVMGSVVSANLLVLARHALG